MAQTTLKAQSPKGVRFGVIKTKVYIQPLYLPPQNANVLIAPKPDFVQSKTA